MGQQQLLLLVLGIVIVGLAVVVGIQAFGENQKKSNSDAMVNDGVRIASDAQAWVLKPTAFGGGDDEPDGLATDGFIKLGYTPNADGEYVNLNGTYEITATSEAITITGEDNNSLSNFLAVTVFGTSPECIVTQVGNTAPTPPTTAPAACTATF